MSEAALFSIPVNQSITRNHTHRIERENEKREGGKERRGEMATETCFLLAFVFLFPPASINQSISSLYHTVVLRVMRNVSVVSLTKCRIGIRSWNGTMQRFVQAN